MARLGTTDKAAWVIKNSYPQVGLDQLSQVAGGGLSEADAITASQSAVWHFTNGFNLRKVQGQSIFGGLESLFGGGAQVGSSSKVMKLYQHLISNAESGHGNVNTLSVNVTSATLKNGLVGPVVINGDAQTKVKASVTGGTLVDAAGKPVDMAAIPVGQPLYLKTSASSGSAQISVAAQVKVSSGRMFVGAGGVRTQNQIGVDSYTRSDKATGTLKWTSSGTATGINGGEDKPTTPITTQPKPGTTTQVECDDSNKTPSTDDDCVKKPGTTTQVECDDSNKTPSTDDDCVKKPATTVKTGATVKTGDSSPPVNPDQPATGCDSNKSTATTADDCPPAVTGTKTADKQIPPVRTVSRPLGDTGVKA